MKKVTLIFLFLLATCLCIAGNGDKSKAVNRILTGKIKGAEGELLSGAKITVVETGETFYSDMEGNYKIEIPADKSYSISILNIGYRPLELNTGALSLFSDLQLQSL